MISLKIRKNETLKKWRAQKKKKYGNPCFTRDSKIMVELMDKLFARN